jgi:hypothetical protein
LDLFIQTVGICSEIAAVTFISIRFVSDNRIKGPKTPLVVEPDDYLRQVIVGLMLGFLTAERASLIGNTRLRFYQSNVNTLYIYHLYSLFKLYVRTGPKEVVRKSSKLTGLIHTDIQFSTLKYPFFNWLRGEFYVDNIKVVPKNMPNYLTSVGLAHWIMDDCSYNKHKGHIILCTDSYTKEDVLFLISILKDKFNLSCGLVKRTETSYRIRINKSSIPQLIVLVKPYFIPSMYYKLGIISSE